MEKMKKFSLPILLTILVIALAALAIIYLNIAQYSAVGSLIGGFGSVLAVIWFFTSLQYQAQQLEEQRTQFSTELKQIRENSRRNALILAKDILNDAERRALAQNPEMKSIFDIMTAYYGQFSDLKSILEERDPTIVQQHVEAWTKREAPASILMNGIKNAAEIYFSAIGQNNIDYSKDAEGFVHIYGDQLWKLPFFQTYQNVATIVAKSMIMLLSRRNAAFLAIQVITCIIADEGKVKGNYIIKEIENHKKKGYPLPRIAEIYLENN